jgi:molybdate transport system substrate-binding protein
MGLSARAGLRRAFFVVNALLVLTLASPAMAAEVTAAIAANFTAPAKEIAAAFKAKTGHSVDLSFGATGQLYTQITQGAPFDILLSADATRPQKAEKEGWGVAASRFTYAIGTLVLWSADDKRVDKDGAVLKTGSFAHLAIANPSAAPYGQAAVETMKALGVYDVLKPKIVMGENINQTFQFVSTGNAELGFVALSQVIEAKAGSSWTVPDTLHAPILQDAILLKAGEQNSFAQAFMSFLKGPEAKAIILRYGYTLPAGS